MSSDCLLRSQDGVVATLTLNRPKAYNAWNGEMRQVMAQAVREIEADDSIRIVIIKGEGRGFSAGADLSEEMPDNVTLMLEKEYKPFLTGIANSNKLYIAQCHGAVSGISAALAMTCDLVVMSDDAFVYMAFAAIGLVPDGGNTQLLLNALGYRRAMQAILEGRRISAGECLEVGIANTVVPLDELESHTQAWAAKLAQGAPLAMAAAKRILRRVGAQSYAEAISTEAVEQRALMNSNDFRAAVDAFFNKQKPVFSGS